MFGRNSIWACWLVIFSFACVSSNLSAKSFEDNSQFALKSLIEFQQQNHLYKPLRIHTKVIEESFSNPEATKFMQSALATSAKIISDLLLTKPLEGKLSLAANNQCPDALFNQISQIQNYEADIAIFAVSNKEKGGISTSKICEESGNKYIKSIALEINPEKLVELDELSQAKELCIAIANALYKGRDEERKALLSEIFEVLAKGREIKIVKFLGACRIGMAGCSACNNEDGTCTDCEEGFSLSDGVCSLTCTPPCEKCSETPTFCTACYDPNHMANNAGTCKCTDPNAFFNTASNTCWCNQGFVNYQGTCTACTPPCVTCTYSPTMCTSCYNANRMILISGNCECADTNAYFNTETLLCTCKPGYFLVNGGYCSKCVSPCKTCSQNSATICETCYDGYYLNGSTCSRCESPCILCTASSCNQCLVGYYLSENTCYLCQEPCLWCTNSATSCTACIVGNYLNGDKCFPCQIPCETCSGSATKCTDCYDSSNMSLNKGVCTCRSPNAYFDMKSLTCQCNSGYYLKEGLCMPCVSPCNICTWTNICQGCIDGYWLNKQNCQACSPPCSKCNTSATQCTACITGTTLNPATSTCSCVDPNSNLNPSSGTCLCNTGYYMSNSSCVPCAAGCEDCDSKGNCNVCSTGYYLSSNKICFSCASSFGCVECSSAKTCKNCIDQHNTQLVAGVCNCITKSAIFDIEGMCVCNSGLFNNTQTNSCTGCPSNCEACSSATECDQCWDSTMTKNAIGECICAFQYQEFNPNTHLCECPSHQYVNVDTKECLACGERCDVCTEAKTCTTCFDPDHMTNNEDGTCNCTNSKQEFSVANERCRDRDSGAYVLTFTWIIFVIPIALSVF